MKKLKLDEALATIPINPCLRISSINHKRINHAIYGSHTISIAGKRILTSLLS